MLFFYYILPEYSNSHLNRGWDDCINFYLIPHYYNYSMVYLYYLYSMIYLYYNYSMVNLPEYSNSHLKKVKGI